MQFYITFGDFDPTMSIDLKCESTSSMESSCDVLLLLLLPGLPLLKSRYVLRVSLVLALGRASWLLLEWLPLDTTVTSTGRS